MVTKKTKKRAKRPKIEQYENMEAFFSYGIDYINKTIYYGDIEEVDGSETGVNAYSTELFLKSLHLLENLEDDRPITVILNNCGGDTQHAFGIYDAIKLCPRQVNVKVVGSASSAATIILQAANKRSISKNSTLMLHRGEQYAGGHPEKTYNWIDEYKRQEDLMYDIYLNRIREKDVYYNKGKLVEKIQFDSILTSEQALNMGLVDEILS